MRTYRIFAALLAGASGTMASQIDFVTVQSQQFFGGNSNDYDSIAGLSQHLGGSVTATFSASGAGYRTEDEALYSRKITFYRDPL